MPKHVVIKEPVLDASPAPDTEMAEDESTVIEIHEEDVAAVANREENGGEKETLLRMQHNARKNSCETRWGQPNTIEQRQGNCSGGVGWRKQTRQRWELPKLISPLSRENACDGSSGRNPTTTTASQREHKPRHSSSSPLKAPLEAPEQQREFYRSLHEREFATLHEELQYLRMTHLHTQKTLQLKSSEIARLQKDVEEKSREISRLRELLSAERKRRPCASGASPADDENYVFSDPSCRAMSPSLALFAATAVSGRSHGQPAKMLLELRQNIAARDTVINRLRMELESLRQTCKEAVDKARITAEELEDARGRCEKLTAELSAKDVQMENLRSCRCCVPAKKVTNSSDNTQGNADVALHQTKVVESEKHCHQPNDAVESIRLHGDTDSLQPCPVSTRLQLQQEQQLVQKQEEKRKLGQGHGWEQKQQDLHHELEHLRRCLEREKESSAESEREWRRRRVEDLRMAEDNLNAAKAQASAYRSEMLRMQQQVSSATFAETQLEAARNENEAMRLRVHELREEANALASREMELQNDMRALKEAYNRREDEVASLQRRLTVSKEGEERLREEINLLEGKLARGEKTQAADRDLSFAAHDHGSYSSLMSLNLELQKRIRTLEVELLEAKKFLPFAAPPSPPPPAAAAAAAVGVVAVDKAVCTEDDERDGDNHDYAGTRNFAAVSKRIAQLAVEVAGLKVQLNTAPHGSQNIPLCQCGEVAGKLTAIDGDHGKGSSKKNAVEVMNMATCKKKQVGVVRGRIAEVQRQAYTTGTLDALQTEVQELRDRLFGYEEALEHARQQIAAAEGEVDTLRQERSVWEGLVRSVGERKVLSLRAARKEATQWKQQVTRLQQQCEEQQRVIATLHMSPPALTSASPSSDAAVVCSSSAPPASSTMVLDDEHIIEEALRKESARLDSEMEVLRHELHATRQERDHWMALAATTARGNVYARNGL